GGCSIRLPWHQIFRYIHSKGYGAGAIFGPPSASSAADSFLPPGNWMTRAAAVIGSDFALYPSTVIWAPVFKVSRAQPFRVSSVGLAASKVQFRSTFASRAVMWIMTWGLFHSTWVTFPSNRTGAFASNSSAKG